MKGVRSVERAIDILLSFTRTRPTMDVTELQERIGLARPTLYRMLRTLEQRGLVRSAGEPRRYELGYRVVELANIWLSHVEVGRVAEPFLEALREATNETIALSIPLSPAARMCAMEFASRQPLTFSVGRGHTGPTHIGASGKVLLAYCASAEIDAVLAQANMAVSAAACRAELEQIKEDGYAVTRGEVILGAVAIAAPIFDRAGLVIAAVSLVGPEARLKGTDRQRCIRLVRETAGTVSAAMGFRAGSKRDETLTPATDGVAKVSVRRGAQNSSKLYGVKS